MAVYDFGKKVLKEFKIKIVKGWHMEGANNHAVLFKLLKNKNKKTKPLKISISYTQLYKDGNQIITIINNLFINK